MKYGLISMISPYISFEICLCIRESFHFHLYITAHFSPFVYDFLALDRHPPNEVLHPRYGTIYF